MKRKIIRFVSCSLVCAMLAITVFPTTSFAENNAEIPEETVDVELPGEVDKAEVLEEVDKAEVLEEVDKAEVSEEVDEAEVLEEVDEAEIQEEKVEDAFVDKLGGGQLNAVTALKARAAGKGRIRLTWDAVEGAKEYIVYRQIGKGKFQYLYVTSNTNYMDMTASGVDFNFYRVYPSYINDIGERITGPSTSYVYAKAGLESAKNLKAEPAGKNRVKLTWDKVKDAEGYIIYRQIGKTEFKYLYVTSNTSYIDSKASGTEFNFYRVYPYYKENGKNVTGRSDKYVYCKAALAPVTNFQCSTSGKNVKLTWNKVNGAEGYIIYRRVGNGEFKYLYMKGAKDTSFVDTKPSISEVNYYRVYPYYKENGKNVIGKSDKYHYSIIKIGGISKFDISTESVSSIRFNWSRNSVADGYIILRGPIANENDAVIVAEILGNNNTSFIYNQMPTEYTIRYGVVPFAYDIDGSIVLGDMSDVKQHFVPTKENMSVVDVNGYRSYTEAYKVLDIVNKERAKVGLKPLVMDESLLESAMVRAAELFIFFNHTRPSGYSCFSINDKVFGENIASGYRTPEHVMNGWMNSQGHRENILRDYSTIGIGCVEINGMKAWVQVFGIDEPEKTKNHKDGMYNVRVYVDNWLLR